MKKGKAQEIFTQPHSCVQRIFEIDIFRSLCAWLSGTAIYGSFQWENDCPKPSETALSLNVHLSYFADCDF